MYRHLISRIEIHLFEAHRSCVISVSLVLWSTFDGHVALFVISKLLSVSRTEFSPNIEAAETAVLLLDLAGCGVPFWNGPSLFCVCCGKYLHEELFIGSA